MPGTLRTACRLAVCALFLHTGHLSAQVLAITGGTVVTVSGARFAEATHFKPLFSLEEIFESVRR